MDVLTAKDLTKGDMLVAPKDESEGRDRPVFFIVRRVSVTYGWLDVTIMTWATSKRRRVRTLQAVKRSFTMEEVMSSGPDRSDRADQS